MKKGRIFSQLIGVGAARRVSSERIHSGCQKLDRNSVKRQPELMLQHRQLAALQALYQLARADQPATRAAVARKLGVGLVVVARLLAELERLGMVDARRTRLTMVGLTVAVANAAAPSRRARASSRGCVAA